MGKSAVLSMINTQLVHGDHRLLFNLYGIKDLTITWNGQRRRVREYGYSVAHNGMPMWNHVLCSTYQSDSLNHELLCAGLLDRLLHYYPQPAYALWTIFDPTFDPVWVWVDSVLQAQR